MPPVVLLVGVVGFIVLMGSKETPQPRDIEVPPPLVETVSVTQTNGGLDLNADGVVVPFRSVILSAEVEGRVTEKSDDCRAGRTVRAGDLLLKIDPATYELEIARLERERDQALASLEELSVQIANAEASIEIAKEDVALRQTDYNRVVGLEKRGVSTQQALDAARREELVSRTALVQIENEKRLLTAQRARLEQAVKLTDVQLEQAKLDLARTEIRAPYDGVIVSADVEKDSYLKKGDAIVDIEDTSAVEVLTNLEMRAIAWLRANRPVGVENAVGAYDIPQVPVTVTYEVLGNSYAWQGVLARIDGIGVDDRTRTVPCRVLVSEPTAVSLKDGSPDLPVAAPSALTRGMYVKVQLHTTPTEPLLSVPETAVRPGNAVWVVRDGKLSYFTLPAARVTRGSVLVAPQVTELMAGDRVVVSPLPAAKVGMEVRVQMPPKVETAAPSPGNEDDDGSRWADRRSAQEEEARR
ncbi:MAG: HlyD family efflux transporter periplasmic adaptor subunit [Planctomycetota bacterium]|nr:HlyD family efflux transporter periplasmic adaptor subunit [Planctomycetota bacterium]